MQIFILDYSTSSADLIEIEDTFFNSFCKQSIKAGHNIGEDTNDKIEFFLSHHCNYKLDVISYMWSEDKINTNYTIYNVSNKLHN